MDGMHLAFVSITFAENQWTEDTEALSPAHISAATGPRIDRKPRRSAIRALVPALRARFAAIRPCPEPAKTINLAPAASDRM